MVLRPARILVVDDEPGMLRAVERVLSQDHQVLATRLSRDALAIADEFRPELAIVDIRMPDLDGFELMAQLKARFPALDVILMTGSVDDLPRVASPDGRHVGRVGRADGARRPHSVVHGRCLGNAGGWDGRAEARLTSAIERSSKGGGSLLDTILADVNRELEGRCSPTISRC